MAHDRGRNDVRSPQRLSLRRRFPVQKLVSKTNLAQGA